MKRKLVLLAAAGALLFAALSIGGALLLFAGPGGGLLGGTDISEKDLSRARQLKLLGGFSPVPIPASASAIRLRYRKFQDDDFEGSFTLPPRDFKSYIARLKPLKSDPGSGPAPPGTTHYAGKRVYFTYTSRIRAQPARRRITIFYNSA